MDAVARATGQGLALDGAVLADVRPCTGEPNPFCVIGQLLKPSIMCWRCLCRARGSTDREGTRRGVGMLHAWRNSIRSRVRPGPFAKR